MSTAITSVYVGTKRKSRAEVAFAMIDKVTEIGNSAEAIGAAVAVLNDETATKISKKQATRSITKLAQDVQELKSCGPKSIAQISPHRSLLYSYDRMKEFRTEPETNNSTNYRRLPLKNITNNARQNSRRRQRNLPSIKDPSIPEPEDGGLYYSRNEVVDILSPLSPKARSKLIDKWVLEKCIPVSRMSVYRMMKHYKEGTFDSENGWGKVGRPPVLTKKDLIQISKDLNKSEGKTIGKKELTKILETKMSEKANKRGNVLLGAKEYSHQTVKNYMSLLTHVPGLSLTHTAIKKTQSRYAAENSVIGSLSFMLVTAATHLIPGEPDDETKEIMKKASEGSKKMIELTSKAQGNIPLQPVKPQYVYSSDDNVEYVYAGTSDAPDPFRVVASKHASGAGDRSKYKEDNSKQMSGMRVKRSWIFNAVGQVAPLCISVAGLTESELPKEKTPSGILVLEIEGLCPGGHSLPPMGTARLPVGYLLLLRNDNDGEQDKKRYKWIQENIFLPFVASNREQHDNWIEGTPIPQSMMAVSWCDGDNAQIKMLVEDSTLAQLGRLNITVNKQHAARTGTEQAADLTKTFKICNSLQQTTTAEHKNHLPIKKNIGRALTELASNGKLKMSLRKRTALTDFIASTPESVTKAVSPDNIQHGFLENGLIDKKAHELPDFDKMLATCRSEISKELYDKIVSDFPGLLQHQLEHGHVPDSVYQDLGYPMDKDMNGDIVIRDATITQENHQRAKCLSHTYQKQLRQARLDELAVVAAQKVLKQQNDVLRLLAQNAEAEDRMIAGFDMTREEVIDVTLEQIKQAIAPQLKAFIHVRTFDTYARPAGSEKWPNKGSLQDAKADPPVNCLILQAYNVKGSPIKLVAASQERMANTNERDPPDECAQVHQQADVWPVYTNNNYSFGVASDILKSDNFLSHINLCFNSTGEISVATEISTDMANSADILQARLIARLAIHEQQRLPPNKRNHWCLRWFKTNIPIVSATMVALKHVKSDLTCLGLNDCLLSMQNNFCPASNSEGDLEGCYLYFDKT
jgi:hypothetical protein